MLYWTITITADTEPELTTVREHLDCLWEGDDTVLAHLVQGVREHDWTVTDWGSAWSISIAAKTQQDIDDIQRKLIGLAGALDRILLENMRGMHQHGVHVEPLSPRQIAELLAH